MTKTTKAFLAALIFTSFSYTTVHASEIVNTQKGVDLSQDANKIVNAAWVLTERQAQVGQKADFNENLKTVGKLYLQQMVLGNVTSGTFGTGPFGASALCNDFAGGGPCSGSGSASSWLDSILTQAGVPVISGSTGGSISDVLTGGSNTTPIDIGASSGVDISGGGIATGNTPGGDIIGGILNGGNTSSGGIINGDGSISNGGWDTGSSDLSTGNGNDGLGSLASLFTGRQLSLNASYSVQSTHPQYVQGFASIDPENPLKHDNVTTKAWVTALTLPPTAKITWDSPPVVTESKVYDNATPVGSVEEKQYVFAYTYQPPCDSKGYYPPPQKGTCVVTLRFKISEFNALGGTGDTYNNVGGSSASTGGFGLIGSPTVVSGNSSPSGSVGGIVAPSIPKSNVSSLSGALNDLMNGGIPYPFGSMTTPSVNVNIPGVGNGLMSLSNTIGGFLKDMMPHSKDGGNNNNNKNEQETIPDGPMPTPDEVRQEHINDMSSIVNTAQEILKTRGVVIQTSEDVKKLYDPDSPYTDPQEAWDFNRLTQFIK